MYLLVACAIIAFVFGHVSHGITAMVPSHSTSFLMPIIALSLCPSSPISFPYVDVVLNPLAGLSDVACPHTHSHNTQCTRFYAFPCSLILSTCSLPLLQSHLHMTVPDPSDVFASFAQSHVMSHAIHLALTSSFIIIHSWCGAIIIVFSVCLS